MWNHLSKDLPVAPGVKSALFPIEAVYIPVEQREIVLAEYRESGLFNYYGSIKQGGNIYDVVVPKTITVYFENKEYDGTKYPEKCQPKPSWWAGDPDCYKMVKRKLNPSGWPI